MRGHGFIEPYKNGYSYVVPVPSRESPWRRRRFCVFCGPTERMALSADGASCKCLECGTILPEEMTR